MGSEIFKGVRAPNVVGVAAGTATPVMPAAPTTTKVQQQVESPKVQAPKSIEIHLDVEKMKADLQKSLDEINKNMVDGGRKLSFSIDSSVGGPVVLVRNAETGDVVRQIPNEVVVRIAHSIDEFKGLLHNKLT